MRAAASAGMMEMEIAIDEMAEKLGLDPIEFGTQRNQVVRNRRGISAKQKKNFGARRR